MKGTELSQQGKEQENLHRDARLPFSLIIVAGKLRDELMVELVTQSEHRKGSHLKCYLAVCLYDCCHGI